MINEGGFDDGDALADLAAAKEAKGVTPVQPEATVPATAAAEVQPKAGKSKGKAKKKATEAAGKATESASPGGAAGAATPAGPTLAQPEAPAVVQGNGFTPAHYARMERCRDALAAARQIAKETHSDLLYLDPDCVLIWGLDTPERPDPLSDPERAHYPTDKQWVELFHDFGWFKDEPGPIVVRQIDGVGEVPFALNARQRIKNARAACDQLMSEGGQRFLGVFVQVTEEDAALTALKVSALNAYRQEDGAMVKCRRAARLLEFFGEVDPATGKPRAERPLDAVMVAMRLDSDQQVRNYAAIAAAPEKVHRALDDGEITMTSIVPLMRKELSDSDREMILADALDRGLTSVTDVRGLVKCYLGEVETDPNAPKTKKKKGKRDDVWTPGTAPKKRFVTRLIERILEKEEKEALSDELNLILKFARFVNEGDAPPKPIAAMVRSLNGD